MPLNKEEEVAVCKYQTYLTDKHTHTHILPSILINPRY